MNIDLRVHASANTGLFPVHKNKFKVNTKGRTKDPLDMVIIKGLENFAPSIDGGIEEFYLMEDEGWVSRMLTAKSLGFTFTGKRIYGDPGNDYIGDGILNIGQEADSEFEWEFPSGAKLTMDCVISLTTPGGGDTTNVNGLEFELLSHGKPTFTPASEII